MTFLYSELLAEQHKSIKSVCRYQYRIPQCIALYFHFWFDELVVISAVIFNSSWKSNYYISLFDWIAKSEDIL